MPKQLLPGENRVVPPLHRHWVVVAQGLALPTLGLAAVIGLVDGVGSLASGASSAVAGVQVVVTLVGLSMGAVWGGWVWLNWSAAELTLTDQRVILEEGVLIRTTQVIPLDRVQDVATRQGLMGRLLDYGTVEVDTAGTVANEVYRYVPAPEWLRDQIFVLSERLRRGGGGL